MKQLIKAEQETTVIKVLKKNIKSQTCTGMEKKHERDGKIKRSYKKRVEWNLYK